MMTFEVRVRVVLFLLFFFLALLFLVVVSACFFYFYGASECVRSFLLSTVALVFSRCPVARVVRRRSIARAARVCGRDLRAGGSPWGRGGAVCARPLAPRWRSAAAGSRRRRRPPPPLFAAAALFAAVNPFAAAATCLCGCPLCCGCPNGRRPPTRAPSLRAVKVGPRLAWKPRGSARSVGPVEQHRRGRRSTAAQRPGGNRHRHRRALRGGGAERVLRRPLVRAVAMGVQATRRGATVPRSTIGVGAACRGGRRANEGGPLQVRQRGVLASGGSAQATGWGWCAAPWKGPVCGARGAGAALRRHPVCRGGLATGRV